jgi:hypothetical protein
MPSKKPNRINYSGVAPYADQAQLIRCQSLTSSSDFTQERLLELASKGTAEVIDESSVTATLEFNDYGGTDNFVALLGQGLYNSTRTNDYIHDDLIFENASVDITARIAGDNASTIQSTMWLGNAFLTGFSMSYSVDGVATESYDFEGDFKRWFLNEYKNASSYKADYSSATTAVISGTNLAASSDTGVGILVTVNNEIVADTPGGDTVTVVDNGADTDITCSPALALVDGDRIRLVASGTGTTFPALPTTPDGIGGLRGDMIDIYLWDPSSGNEEKMLRAQSVDITVDLSRETKEELGNNKPYFRALSRPIDVAVTVELADSDLEVIAKLAGSETTWDADTLDSIDIDSFVRTNKLFVKIYNSETARAAANLLKMIEITNLSVGSEETAISVGEDQTTSLTLQSDNVLVSGSGNNPLL